MEFLSKGCLFSLPVSYDWTRRGQKCGGLMLTFDLDYLGVVLMLPLSHPLPSPVVNHTD